MARRKKVEEKVWDFGAKSDITQELGVEASKRLAERYKRRRRAEFGTTSAGARFDTSSKRATLG